MTDSHELLDGLAKRWLVHSRNVHPHLATLLLLNDPSSRLADDARDVARFTLSVLSDQKAARPLYDAREIRI